MMTRRQFEDFCAEQQRVGFDEISACGGYLVPCREQAEHGPACDCDSPGCLGWRLRYASTPAEWLRVIQDHVDFSPLLAQAAATKPTPNTWIDRLMMIVKASKKAKAVS